MRRHSSVSVKWCGVASAVTRTPRSFARRRASTLLTVETCITCSRPPVASARAMSRLVITSSAAAGMPGSPSTSETSPSCITPPLGQLADLGVVEHRLVEHQAVLEGPAHQLGVVDRGAVVAEGHGAGLDQLADLGQFLALRGSCSRRRRRRRCSCRPGRPAGGRTRPCPGCRSAGRCWACRRSR